MNYFSIISWREQFTNAVYLVQKQQKNNFIVFGLYSEFFFTDTSERYSKIILKGVQIMCSETKHNTTNSTRQTTIKQCMTKPSSKFGEKKT